METLLDNTIAFECNKHTPDIRFLASLSDSRTVIQDNKPGIEAAWKRLAKFIRTNPTISITCVRLQAPGKDDITMPSNQKGYMFGNRHRKVFPGGEQAFIGIGYYDGVEVHERWFEVPSFRPADTATRTKEKAGFFLIENLPQVS